MMARLESTTLRGLRTAWMEAGEPGKPILLFLHGYPDSPETWEFQVDHFSRNYHVIAPYSRGAGESEKSDSVSRYGSDACALDLLQLLAQVDPTSQTPVIVVGHDLGAVHAWSLAPLLGDRLQGLIILNGMSLAAMMGRLRSISQHRRSWYIYGMQLPWVPEAVIRHFPNAILNFAHDVGKLPGAHRLTSEQVEGCMEHPVNQYRAFVRDIPKVRRRRLPRLQCPVMVVWGKEDPFLVTPTVAEWEQAAADITTRILPAGHWVHRERAPEINRLIEKFLGEKVTAPKGNA
jgi:pimeloyl-ACP methyl ester carboxylesterase